MMKVGKVAAVALGGGIILLQVASHNGYVKVNWERLYKKVEEAESAIEAKAQDKGPKILNKVKNFARNNTYLAAGYASGFLIGIAT